MAEFASKGVAGAGLGTGIAGLSLGVLNSGLLPNLFGGGAYGNAYNSPNPPATRYDLGMLQELAAKDARIGLLESQVYVDQKLVETYTALDSKINGLATEVRGNKDAQAAINLEQAVLNGTTGAAISCINERVADLRAIINGITKTVVPNDAVCPGWGPVRVVLETTTSGGTT